jgi:streptomycin 6-kinase
MEYADGEDLTGFVQHGEDETATEIIGEVISALHSKNDAPPEGIMTLRRWFWALFVQADQDRKKGVDSIFIRAADRADKVLVEPREQRVLHGDIHHENIRHSSRGWLAFDPKGLYGECAYDLANTLCNPRPMYGVDTADEGRILRNVEILAQKTGIERDRILLFLYLYACLSASWTLENPETEVANITRIAEIAEQHINR